MKTAVAVIALVAAHAAWGQEDRKESAFGFWRGMTLQQAQVAAPLTRAPNAPSYYGTKVAPLPVYPFTVYSVAIGRTAGVCMVVALTDHQADGSKIHKDMVAAVFQMLLNRYGKPTDVSETDTARTVKWVSTSRPW